jgi:SpoIID/LytB domain protein
LIALLLAAGVVAVPLPVAAQGEPVVVIQGRGWGHGRGMGQYGALGYAVDQGWDWRQILQHYYGNTTEGSTGTGGGSTVPNTVGVGVSRRAGYWVVTSAGAVVARDGAPDQGSMAGRPLNAPVLGLAPGPGDAGYWLVAADGGIFSFGTAPFYGSTGAMRLNQPVVGMASTPTGAGYWLVARDGGVFSFGDARFAGSTGAMRLNRPVVGMAAPATGGYWLVASDGGIFAFGAPFYGSTGGMRLNQPVVAMAATPSGNGYWLLGRDGGVFNFGDAALYGSLPGRGINAQAVGIAPSRGGNGYWIVTADGRAYPFGDAAVPITVDLSAQAGQDLIVWRPNGGLRTNGTGGTAAAWRVRNAGGGWLVDRGDTCAGPWTQVTPQPVGTDSLEVFAPDVREGSSDYRDLLGLCRAEGIRFYRGQLHAYRDAGTMRTRNSVDLELYLQGVVPRESPASWGDLGNGRGVNALAAQAVAARSYAWAENRRLGAKTCDTTTCQVYGGAFLLVNGDLTALEDARSTSAVRATAGVIRLLGGQPARTEFSASSGGQTVAGVFPPVRDDGDAIASNPVHAWTEQVKVSAVQAAWPAIGSLTSIQVLSRDGLGEWGGRAVQVRLVGTTGTVDVSGDTFRSRLAAPENCTKVGTSNLPQCMKSTWFNVASGPTLAAADLPSAGSPIPAPPEPASVPPDERQPE